MFRIILKDAKVFRDCIDIISQLIDDGLFKFNKNGVELIASDRAMVAVVDFKMNSSAFDEYNCEEESIVGLNLLNFLTFLKRAGPEDKLTMNLKENKLELLLEGKTARKFSIPLLEMSPEELPPIDKLEFSANAEIRSDIVEQGINDADIIADSVVIELNDNKIMMTAEGDSSKTELNLEKGNENLLNLSTRNFVKSRYPLDYLKKMIKSSKISEKIKIQLGTDYPLRLEFKGENISMNFTLAPRVSEE